MICLPLLLTGQSNPFTEIADPVFNSPYSRFGLGDLVQQNHSFLHHMGGLSASFQDRYNVNIVNPASLPYLKATSFETGLNAKYGVLREGDEEFNSWTGSLSYFSLAFPLSNPINDLLDRVDRKYDLGMAFSLQPYTNVGYNVASIGDSNGVTGIQRNYIGAGGTYSAQWGTGIKYKDFSAGINLGYVFGKIATYRTVTFTDFENSYANFERISSNLTGFIYNLGVQQNITLNKAQIAEDKTKSTKQITVGAYVKPSTGFKTVREEEYLLVNIDPNVDTITTPSSIEGLGKLPATLGLGFMYNELLSSGEKKWGIGVNYESQLWSNYENDASPATLNNSYRISAGGYLRPDPKSITNYFKRIYYQAGVFYHTEPAQVFEQQLTQFGGTFGVGMPFINQRKISNANIGVTLGARGLNTIVEERYVLLNFGFTFNSNEWFLKRKYK